MRKSGAHNFSSICSLRTGSHSSVFKMFSDNSRKESILRAFFPMSSWKFRYVLSVCPFSAYLWGMLESCRRYRINFWNKCLVMISHFIPAMSGWQGTLEHIIIMRLLKSGDWFIPFGSFMKQWNVISEATIVHLIYFLTTSL